jgi:hypothetical protein
LNKTSACIDAKQFISFSKFKIPFFDLFLQNTVFLRDQELRLQNGTFINNSAKKYIYITLNICHVRREANIAAQSRMHQLMQRLGLSRFEKNISSKASKIFFREPKTAGIVCHALQRKMKIVRACSEKEEIGDE